MTISTTDFPIWFLVGFYGGLVCCVLTILISLRALYTADKTTRNDTSSVCGPNCVSGIVLVLIAHVSLVSCAF